MNDDQLTCGWFLPTTGRSTCLSDPGGHLAQSRELFDEFVDAGCTSFCLSGYPHAHAARTFATKVLPRFDGCISTALPRAA